MHVTGLGQCSLDYLAVVDSYPDADTKKETMEWHEQCGGPVATALVTLSRLCIPCSFHGVTGDDEAGGKIRKSLLAEKIDVHGLIRRKNASSQTAFIVIEKGAGRRTIFWRRPSGRPIEPRELGDNYLAGTDFLLLDGLMREASMHAAKRARARKIPVMLDAGTARPGMLELTGFTDYLVASAEFAKGLGWSLEPEVLKEEKEKLGVKALTITCGEGGSITVAEDQVIEVPAFHVEAVDTTGAGDVFHGGYVYGVLQGWDLRRTIIFASAIAAMKCRAMGGRAGIPGLEEAAHFLKERGHCEVTDCG